jgi:hypothetical protein
MLRTLCRCDFMDILHGDDNRCTQVVRSANIGAYLAGVCRRSGRGPACCQILAMRVPGCKALRSNAYKNCLSLLYPSLPSASLLGAADCVRCARLRSATRNRLARCWPAPGAANGYAVATTLAHCLVHLSYWRS